MQIYVFKALEELLLLRHLVLLQDGLSPLGQQGLSLKSRLNNAAAMLLRDFFLVNQCLLESFDGAAF